MNGNRKKKKSQLHSFLRLVYTGTMTRIYPSIDIPFQNKDKFIPEKCPHGDNQEVPQRLGMFSFQSFLSGARHLQNAVDMMKVWVFKFPEISELPPWQLCQPSLGAAPSSAPRVLPQGWAVQGQILPSPCQLHSCLAGK